MQSTVSSARLALPNMRPLVLARDTDIRGVKPIGFAVCIGAFAICEVTAGLTYLNWWISWMSGMALLVLALNGKIFHIPSDIPRVEQSLRPWFLTLTIFCSFNFLTSIFYFLNLQGFYYFWNQDNFIPDLRLIEYAAHAQRMYLVGEIGVLLGLGVAMNWRPKLKTVIVSNLEPCIRLLYFGAIAFVAFLVFSVAPGLSQLAERSRGVMLVAFAVSLGVAVRTRSNWTGMSIFINGILFMLALASGWKSEVVILLILHAVTFYPLAPVATTVLFSISLVIGTVALPTIANEIRAKNWSGRKDTFTATQEAITKLTRKTRKELSDISWVFLCGRLSEQSLFVKYLASVPSKKPYFGFEILKQSGVALVPRVLWPSKPVTEVVVHKRVVELGAISARSRVSAKPQYVVDGYLSFGTTGVFFSLFLLGVIMQLCGSYCESALGGPLYGAILFNGLFSTLRMASCFEFFANAIFYSIVCAVVLNVLMTNMGYLQRVSAKYSVR